MCCHGMPVQPCGVAATGLYLGAGFYFGCCSALSGVVDWLGMKMRELRDRLVGAASSPSWEAAKSLILLILIAFMFQPEPFAAA